MMVGFTLMKVSFCRTMVSAAEDEHDDRGNHRHDRQTPRQRIGHRQRDQHRHHEHPGGGENAELGVGARKNSGPTSGPRSSGEFDETAAG